MKQSIAILLYYLGIKPTISTFIDEDTITAGYGKLDHIGWFEYPLPRRLVKRIMRYNTWSERAEYYNKVNNGNKR